LQISKTTHRSRNRTDKDTTIRALTLLRNERTKKKMPALGPDNDFKSKSGTREFTQQFLARAVEAQTVLGRVALGIQYLNHDFVNIRRGRDLNLKRSVAGRRRFAI